MKDNIIHIVPKQMTIKEYVDIYSKEPVPKLEDKYMNDITTIKEDLATIKQALNIKEEENKK
jgi:hypothetical protein